MSMWWHQKTVERVDAVCWLLACAPCPIKVLSSPPARSSRRSAPDQRRLRKRGDSSVAGGGKCRKWTRFLEAPAVKTCRNDPALELSRAGLAAGLAVAVSFAPDSPGAVLGRQGEVVRNGTLRSGVFSHCWHHLPAGLDFPVFSAPTSMTSLDGSTVGGDCVNNVVHDRAIPDLCSSSTHPGWLRSSKFNVFRHCATHGIITTLRTCNGDAQALERRLVGGVDIRACVA
jgi:hypothetical protein